MKKIKVLLALILIVGILVLIINVRNTNAIENTQNEENILEQANTEIQGLTIYADDLIPDKTDEESINFNTKYLQDLIDEASDAGGGTVKIPAGIYYFASSGKNGRQIADYVIFCRNNVTVEGNGSEIDNVSIVYDSESAKYKYEVSYSATATVLRPYGTTDNGLDMFYYNQYIDSIVALEKKLGISFTNYEDLKNYFGDGNNNTIDVRFIENADFKNFAIDGAYTIGNTYNSSGKGFMMNLYKDCDWENVVVSNTDGTGFGMDSPINCTINKCIAIGCGKNATSSSAGASGFGIGTGFSNEETIQITNCTAIGNTKFGFFFEHQSRFQNYYRAQEAEGFSVSNCIAVGNLYDFGGLRANDVTYENCTSGLENLEIKSKINHNEEELKSWISNTNISGIHFDNLSVRNAVTNCKVDKGFPDVSETDYYYDAVYWAQNNGIAEGSSVDGTFNADGQCDKKAALAFLWRMSNLEGDVVYGYIDQNPTVYENNVEVAFKTGYADIDNQIKEGNSYYIGAVYWAKNEGIIDYNSLNNNYFYPDEACTRGEFVTWLWRYADSPKVEIECPFEDIKGTEYEEAVKWAYSKGIITGINSNTFSPQDTCTRAQIILMFYRYANSSEMNFKITYHLDGGDVSVENPVAYVSGQSNITLNNPTKIGYTFKGWTGSNCTENGYLGQDNFNPEQTVTITNSDVGNKIYTANWTPNNYSVSFDSNGGTGEMNDENFKYDVPQILSPNEFVKTGYDFNGWNTKADGTGTAYNNAQAVSNLTEVANEKITLYAQWVASEAENRENVFIGDSLFVEMHNIIGDNGDIYSAGRGQGIEWVKNTGLPMVEDEIDINTNIIIGIGTNDLFNPDLTNGQVDVDGVVEKYKKYFNAKAIQWIQSGAKVYFVSVGPFDDSKIDSSTRLVNNADAIKFNTNIQSVLRGITFIDIYTEIIDDFNKKDPDLTREDGTHGTALLYSKRYNIIKEALGQVYTPTYEAFELMNDIEEGSNYYLPAKWACENVYMDPTASNEYRPNTICTRAETISLLWRSQGMPFLTSNSFSFSDVSESDLFYDAVVWGLEKGISNGKTSTTFEPNGECTRGDFITFLWRMSGSPAVDSNNDFVDVAENETYTNAVNWAVSKGIIQQNPENTFRPEDGCTRAEAITFLFDYYYNDLKGDADGDGTITAYDAYQALLCSTEETISNQMIYILDMDEDGTVTSFDAYTILKKSIGL